MRQRGEITARADRPAAWNNRQDIAIQEREQIIRDQRPYSAVAAGQDICPKQEEATCFFQSQGIADARRMAAN